jgi:hypothetical protein
MCIAIGPRTQCFGTDIVYYIYLLLKFTVPKNVIIFKSKVLLLHEWVTLVDFGILMVYWPLDYCFQTLLNYLGLQYFDIERNLMKIIPEMNRAQ